MLSHFLRKLGSVAGVSRRDAPCETVAAGGLTWEVTPAGATLFGPGGPDVAGWLAAAEVVKQNRSRTIYRVRLPAGAVYVKHCRANTPRAWVRELLRPAKARLEFENALTLRARGVPVIEPLACGTVSAWRPGDSYLVTRAQDAAEPLVTFLDRTLPGLPVAVRPAVRRQVTRGLAALVARMHDAGVAHPDPHPGNCLVELPPSRVPRFFLTDLHDVRVGRPLSWAQTRANLSLLTRWFQVRGTRHERLRGWRAYVAARATLPAAVAADADRRAKELEAATLASNNRFWADRVKRYGLDNRDSRRVRGPAARGYAARTVPADVLRRWLADPDAVFAEPGVRVLKDSPSSTVAEVVIPTPDGPRAVVYKRFPLKSPVGAVKNLLRPSPALRSWVLGNGVRDRGLPTAAPLAAFHRRRLGVPREGYAVFEKVPDALGLTEAVARLAGAPPAVRRRALRLWAEKLGRVVRTMHEREVSHRDLKAPNVLMARAAADPLAAEPVLIDLVGVKAGRPVTAAKRIRDLARLNASFLSSDVVSRADRLRFLRAYLAWGLRGRGGWKDWWTRVAGATRAKAAKNARSGRPLA